MPRTIVNPPGLHDPSGFGYCHVVGAPGELVFIAGQYASDENGQVTSPDFAEQVKRSLGNLRIALEAVGLGFDDVVMIRTYLVDHDAGMLATLVAQLHETWGRDLPAQTLTGVAALALPEMLFEIDAIAARS